MSDDTRFSQLTGLFVDRYRELIEGMPDDEPTWVTTGGRAGGLLGSVSDLSAEQASRDFAGTSIASHVEHVRWAIELANGFFEGSSEQPSWSESWQVKTVDEAAWNDLKARLESASAKLLGYAESRQNWHDAMSATGALASFGHTAYHLGAIRQLRKLVLSPAAAGVGVSSGIGTVHGKVQY